VLYSNRNTKGSDVSDVVDDITLICYSFQQNVFQIFARWQHVVQSAIEKCPTLSLFCRSSSNINRLSKFLHWRTLWKNLQ